jgi:hypothetical protein
VTVNVPEAAAPSSTTTSNTTAPLGDEEHINVGMYMPSGNLVNALSYNKPDYATLSLERQEEMHNIFDSYFTILKHQNQSLGIQIPPRTMALKHRHDIYDAWVRRVLAIQQTPTWKKWLVFAAFFIEVIVVKILGLNFTGFTRSQWSGMSRYDQQLIELGEKQGGTIGSNWPVEIRLIVTMVVSAVIFLLIRYLAQWLGNTELGELLQKFVDGNFSSAINGSSLPPVTVDNNGIPTVPSTSKPEENNSGDGLMGMLSGMFGGSGGNGEDGIGKVIGMVTGLLGKDGKKDGGKKPENGKPRVRGKHRVPVEVPAFTAAES